MKREELKSWLESQDLSIDEKIDMIMSQNGAELESAKSDITEKENSYKDLKVQFDNLSNEYGAYKDSVKDYDDIKNKYNTLLKEKDLNDKLLFLNGLNCKHSDLLVDKFDWEKKEDKDYLSNFKSKYSDLFDSFDKDYKPKKPLYLNGYESKDPDKFTNEDLQKL